ncbi:restriction endonuclease subunit S [Synechococcus sp. Cruz-9H2]|nr:restriction endonuclease subunit S [Synechococcus sp. Cruz-9H2]MCP9842833.1 restriction endonuclease subunit S [Synechococcus sp. Edmonson 11F2]MCP9855499.1 restriction endonuclease subunit S [Synechococcus sp. Cruz-9C9]MCP9862255.1 restriction endonuclease subunit S [Synechococcus sp. Cruz-7E5]MCP9869526.1 restriction endonuclease subunit S [Synechococcus sp. Cruz-7B9]
MGMKEGWQTRQLGEICEIERGGSPRPIQNYLSADSNGINWIKIGDATASGKYIYKTEEKIKPEGARRSRVVYEGDFILSNSMSFGRPYIMKTTGCIHDGWLVLRQPKVDPEYLYYVLSSDLVFSQFDRLAAGSTVRNLNIGLAMSVEIPYPPLPEQQRIVALLDEAFAGLATAKANAERNLQNARALFESHLQSVFSRRGEGWEEKQLRNFCAFENGDRGSNYPSKKARSATGIPFINAGHLTDDGLDLANMDYIPRERFDLLSNGKIRAGDILFCLRGSLGKFACVGDLTEGAIASSLVIVRPDETALNEYLIAYFRSSLCASMINEFKNGTAQPNLSARSLGDFVAPLPPLADQKLIVKELADLRQETQRLASIYELKLAALEELKKTLLHQAFNGEL